MSPGHACLDNHFWLAETVLCSENKVVGVIDPVGGGKEEGKQLGTFCNDGTFIMLMLSFL